MREFDLIIANEIGLHVRPAGLLAEAASKFVSDITVSSNGKDADGKAMFHMMTLGARHGDSVHFSIIGPDEEEAETVLFKVAKKALGPEEGIAPKEKEHYVDPFSI